MSDQLHNARLKALKDQLDAESAKYPEYRKAISILDKGLRDGANQAAPPHPVVPLPPEPKTPISLEDAVAEANSFSVNIEIIEE